MQRKTVLTPLCSKFAFNDVVTDFQADKLSSWLGIDVDEDQVVMSHSPLKMFRDYHNKHVLVIGQGPVDDIARALGFTKVTTIQQLRHAFPTLDNVDHKRRRGRLDSIFLVYKNLKNRVASQKVLRRNK